MRSLSRTRNLALIGEDAEWYASPKISKFCQNRSISGTDQGEIWRETLEDYVTRLR